MFNKLVMVFANTALPYQDFQITGDITLLATAVNKLTIPGLITSYLVCLYRDPASIHQALYPDCKNHAAPSLHRDFILPKVPGLISVLRRVPLTKTYRRAVMLKPQRVTGQIRPDKMGLIITIKRVFIC